MIQGLRLFEKDKKLAERINLLVAEWRLAYPSLDIKSQIAWAHVWLVSNPKNMKKDLIRFLNNWMKGEERRNRDRRIDDRRAPALPPVQHIEVPEEEIVTGEMFAELKAELLKEKLKGKFI